MILRVPCSTANLGPGIDCLGVALNRYLSVEVNPSERMNNTFGIGFDAPIPEKENLFLSAAHAACDLMGKQIPMFSAHMKTEIPTSRGLASSASAIVAGILFADQYYGCPLSVADKLEIATRIEGHPDNVVPCMLGGFTVAMQDGDVVSYARYDVPKDVSFVAAIPDYTLSTHTAREVLPKQLPLASVIAQVQRASLLTAAACSGRWEFSPETMQDAVFTPARKQLIPGFDDVVQAARSHGAMGVMISGAGSTVIAVTKRNEYAVADAMRVAFFAHNVHVETAVLHADNTGATIEKE